MSGLLGTATDDTRPISQASYRCKDIDLGGLWQMVSLGLIRVEGSHYDGVPGWREEMEGKDLLWYGFSFPDIKWQTGRTRFLRHGCSPESRRPVGNF